jgi:hypothetical protein
LSPYRRKKGGRPSRWQKEIGLSGFSHLEDGTFGLGNLPYQSPYINIINFTNNNKAYIIISNNYLLYLFIFHIFGVYFSSHKIGGSVCQIPETKNSESTIKSPG